MNKDEAVTALNDAHNDRALMYLTMFRELCERFGKSEAIEVMRAALYKHGRGFGETLKQYAPNDFRGLYNAFATAPDGGEMFSPRKISCSEDCLEIKFMTCPLKEAWQKVGIDDDELVTLLHVASSLDEGTMDAGGFDLDIQTWQPGEVGCCKLKVTKR